MGKYEKLRRAILNGASDGNIDFDGLCHLLVRLGFDERIRGSHHIFTRENVAAIINIQPRGSLAKDYQVKQIRRIILQNRLGAENVD